MRGRILITPRSLSKGGHPALAPLVEAGFKLEFPAPGATPTEAQLVAALPGVVGWLAGVEKVSEAAIGAADRLRVISRNGSGPDLLLPTVELQLQGHVAAVPEPPRISDSAAGLLRSRSSSTFNAPMPCSAEIEPPCDCTAS